MFYIRRKYFCGFETESGWIEIYSQLFSKKMTISQRSQFYKRPKYLPINSIYKIDNFALL